MLVSIGYAACHWCHVMERESFEDPEIAALMNERFVCIKVDREERPDVDAIYMDAVQAMTGHGRLAAERVPHARRRAVLRRHLLPAASRARACRRWRRSLVGVGERVAASSATEIERAAARRSCRGCRARRLDRRRDGARSPRRRCDAAVATLRARLRPRARRRLGRRAEVPAAVGDRVPARRAASARWRCTRCAAMAARRRSTTRSAAASRATRSTRAGSSRTSRRCSTTTRCSRAPTCTRCQVSGEPLFARVCEETLDWALRELRQDEGGFASSLDADSEGVEGKFYVWTPDEIRAALGDGSPRRRSRTSA